MAHSCGLIVIVFMNTFMNTSNCARSMCYRIEPCIVYCQMLSITNTLFARWQISVVEIQVETTLELAANIFLPTTFRERSSLMSMCLRYDKVSQTGQAQDVATCTYS